MSKSSNLTLRVFPLRPDAVLPKRASSGAAGYDLCAVESGAIEPGGRALVGTGLAIQVPEGTYGRIAPRSGLAVKHGIHVGAGCCDADYRGEYKVLLVNLGDKTYQYTKGDRVAQLIIEKIALPTVVEVLEVGSTERGGGGFGSTGV